MPLPPLLQAHFLAPRQAGEPAGADALGCAANAACGDHLELGLWVQDGRIRDARFRARGCSSLLATASLAAERLVGLDLPGARGLDLGALLAGAGGLPPGRAHARAVVERALDQALQALGDRYP
jgi:nitrogen fixation NifU-like protein